MEEARIFGEEAAKAELEIEKAQQQKELQAQLRAAALERESKLTGVAGNQRLTYPAIPLLRLTSLIASKQE